MSELRLEDLIDLPDAVIAELSRPVREMWAAHYIRLPPRYAHGVDGRLRWVLRPLRRWSVWGRPWVRATDVALTVGWVVSGCGHIGLRQGVRQCEQSQQ